MINPIKIEEITKNTCPCGKNKTTCTCKDCNPNYCADCNDKIIKAKVNKAILKLKAKVNKTILKLID